MRARTEATIPNTIEQMISGVMLIVLRRDYDQVGTDLRSSLM